MPSRDGSTSLAHAQRLFDLWFSQSHDEFGNLIWRGSIIDTALEFYIPIGSYRRVTARMEEIHCIQTVMQGGRGSQSILALLQRPTKEAWASGSTPLTERMSLAKLWQRVDILERRLGGASIVDALANIETRLRNLEARKRGNK